MDQPFNFPLTEKDISVLNNRNIKSPIYISNLQELGIDQTKFVDTFSDLFSELPWDPYDSRRLRVEFLKKCFPSDEIEIQKLFKSYYLGKSDLNVFLNWRNKLSETEKKEFDEIQPWRRRSVCQFLIWKEGETFKVKRQKVKQFAQEVQGDDYRSLPRKFSESPSEHVEHLLFYHWMIAVYRIVKNVRPEMEKINMVGHFMSVKARPQKPGNNSPEGAHEDGADYIVSALVINRKNVKGGETQIIEKVDNKGKEIIFKYTLQPGEFVFQGDSKDEIIHGTDLWHHVTPFALDDESAGEGWRDIIGFDIDIV